MEKGWALHIPPRKGAARRRLGICVHSVMVFGFWSGPWGFISDLHSHRCWWKTFCTDLREHVRHSALFIWRKRKIHCFCKSEKTVIIFPIHFPLPDLQAHLPDISYFLVWSENVPFFILTVTQMVMGYRVNVIAFLSSPAFWESAITYDMHLPPLYYIFPTTGRYYGVTCPVLGNCFPILSF